MGFLAMLAMQVASVTDDGPMRLMLFVLVLIAVILLIVGSIIAVLTLLKQRRTQRASE